MTKRFNALVVFLGDCLWMVPLVASSAIILLYLARYAGIGWAAGYLATLLLMLSFNICNHCRSNDDHPPKG